METIILPFLLAAVLVAAAVADVSVMQHRTQANCHTYTDAAKPASETRPRCPSGRGHAHGHSRGHSHGHTHSPGHHHGHALPPGHQYGQPTGTAVIIAEFFRELRQHKDYVVQDLKNLPEAERSGKFQALLDALKNHTELPTWLNEHCKGYVGKLNRVHKKKFLDILKEEVNLRRLN